MRWAILLALAGCPTPEQPELVLEGPARVRVESLGPVADGPKAVLEDGTVPEGVAWSVEPASVAKIEAGVVEAVGPGEATVTGEWQEQHVQWTLVVEPAVLLTFVAPPASVPVGGTAKLDVRGRIGAQDVAPGALTWSSSAPEVATVADGVVTGVSAGVTYITAKSPSGEAMVEMRVEPAKP